MGCLSEKSKEHCGKNKQSCNQSKVLNIRNYFSFINEKESRAENTSDGL